MHKILFTIGNFPIYSFGVMVALAVLAGSWVTSRNAFRVGLTKDQSVEVVLWVVGLGVLLARVVYVSQESGYFLQHPLEIVNFRGGGMSWHGGIMGLLLGAWLQSRKLKVRTIDLLDLCAPGSMLGLAIGRIGCFLNGCCYGRACDLPWAIYLPDEAGRLAWRHPSQLYEMVGAFIAFAIVLRLLQHRMFAGHAFLAFLFWYSMVRFSVEFYRDSPLLGGFSLAQYVSLALMTVSAGMMVAARQRALAPVTHSLVPPAVTVVPHADV